jgi:hypothetical protein
MYKVWYGIQNVLLMRLLLALKDELSQRPEEILPSKGGECPEA